MKEREERGVAKALAWRSRGNVGFCVFKNPWYAFQGLAVVFLAGLPKRVGERLALSKEGLPPSSDTEILGSGWHAFARLGGRWFKLVKNLEMRSQALFIAEHTSLLLCCEDLLLCAVVGGRRKPGKRAGWERGKAGKDVINGKGDRK